MKADGDGSPARPSLTTLVQGAQRGLRRDVAALEGALDDADLYIPLAQDIPNAPEGEAIPLDRELEIVPHLVSDGEAGRFVALFTSPELVSLLAEQLAWTTDGGELGVCAFPARIAAQLALDLVDETTVHGLVLDPGHPSELVLRRAELASIVAGQPLPLVGYVAELPPLEDERVLVAEPSDPPPAVLTSALERCLAELPVVTSHALTRTFNAERDLEPHLTLRLSVAGDGDRRALAAHVIDAIGELLPPPGYIDVVFDDG